MFLIFNSNSLNSMSAFVSWYVCSMLFIFTKPKYHYRPQRSWGEVIFSEACVKNSVHGGACWDTYPPQKQTPPRKQTPLPVQCMLGDTANKQAVHIILECILVLVFFKIAVERTLTIISGTKRPFA